jgi:predicted DNA-binding mobile mystery protein A
MNSNNKLILKQLDKRLQPLQLLKELEPPKQGWINLIRTTLHMSLHQLAQRLSITVQGAKKIELSEVEGSISLKSLRKAGKALGIKLVYGFVVEDDSLEKMIEKKAAELAHRIVIRTYTTMKLEDQENSSERMKEAIAELTDELKREIPKTLWE